jgi:hypothetical protein
MHAGAAAIGAVLGAIGVIWAPIAGLGTSIQAAAAAGSIPTCTQASLGSTCVDTDGWRWVYSADGKTAHKVFNTSTSSGSSAAYLYLYAPACGGDLPGGELLCNRALTGCGDTDPGAILYDVWREETAPVAGDPVPQGSICLGGPADTITVAQLGKDVDEDVRDHLPALSVRVQPSPAAVVNLPVIVSAPVQPAPDFNVDEPVPGAVTVTSTYRWTFDDGASLVGNGKAYDGTDPRTAPSGYYLAHTYTHAEAHASATLTVTWHAVFTLAGGPPIALPDITTPPQTVAFQVHEVRSVLVS